MDRYLATAATSIDPETKGHTEIQRASSERHSEPDETQTSRSAASRDTCPHTEEYNLSYQIGIVCVQVLLLLLLFLAFLHVRESCCFLLFFFKGRKQLLQFPTLDTACGFGGCFLHCGAVAKLVDVLSFPLASNSGKKGQFDTSVCNQAYKNPHLCFYFLTYDKINGTLYDLLTQ